MPGLSARAHHTQGRWRAVATLITLTLGGLAPAQAALAAAPGPAAISSGGSGACLIESGQAYCWGDNQNGQLGDGSSATGSLTPVPVDTSGVLAGQTLTQVSVGPYSTCALDTAGKAYCWGAGESGELGDGGQSDSSRPVAVRTSGALAGKTLTQISAGIDHTCALDSNGAAYCWGGDDALGAGGTTSSDVPVAVDTSGVLAGKNLTQISAGGSHTCALDSAGAAYCWGDETSGQLGNGTDANTTVTVPVAVDTSGVLAGRTLTQISAGAGTCVLDAAGAAYCWGFGRTGDLGDGSLADSSVPVAVNTSGVLAGKTLTQISADLYGHACALDSAGAAYCWGDNDYGPLGDGGTISSSVPVAVDTSGVLAGKTLAQIASGEDRTCAVGTDGILYCWGNNFGFWLGVNSTDAVVTTPLRAASQGPSGVSATPGITTAALSWTAPVVLNGGTVTGYTATASPGGAACSTTAATSCTINGLTQGTAYSITVTADTTGGDSSAAPVTVTPGSELSVTSDPGATAPFGAPFSFTVTTTGIPAPRITRTGPLPSGLTFTDNKDGTATVAGTPKSAAAGVYPLTFTARNKSGSVTAAFALTVTRAPAFSKIGATTQTTVGNALDAGISATGYPAPAFSLSGSLPAGLSLTDNGDGTAAITGTAAPGTGGSYPLTVTATNGSGAVSRAITVRVNEAPVITSAATATAATGSPFSFQFTATGFPAPRFLRTGPLPKGLSYSTATRTFSGTPKAGDSGSYPMTLTVQNGSGTVTQTFTITFGGGGGGFSS